MTLGSEMTHSVVLLGQSHDSLILISWIGVAFVKEATGCAVLYVLYVPLQFQKTKLWSQKWYFGLRKP